MLQPVRSRHPNHLQQAQQHLGDYLEVGPERLISTAACVRRYRAASVAADKPHAHLSTACVMLLLQEFPDLEKQANWNVDTAPEPVDWDGLIKEALERGRAVPEVTWRKPGEDGAREVRTHPCLESSGTLSGGSVHKEALERQGCEVQFYYASNDGEISQAKGPSSVAVICQGRLTRRGWCVSGTLLTESVSLLPKWRMQHATRGAI